jgi:DNA-binding beta-propeller fold protein YncE
MLGCDETPSDQGVALRVKRVLGEPGKQRGQFMYPRGIAAGEGQLWVVDKGARIQRLDPESGNPIAFFQTPNFAQGKPTGLTVAPMPGDGSQTALYVADTHYNRILIYKTDSESTEPVAEFGTYGTLDGQFVYPTDIAVLTDDSGEVERIYVTEYGGNDRVSIFDADMNFLTSFGTFGVAHEQEEGATGFVFDRPQAIQVDKTVGELVIADSCNHRVGRFTLDGELISWLGGADSDLFRYPYGLELVEGRGVLVAEYGGNRIRHVELETGTTLGVYGSAGREEGQLASPWGAAVLGSELFLLDSGNNRIQVIESPAKSISQNGGDG